MDWAILIVAVLTLLAAVVFGVWTVALARRSEARISDRGDVSWIVDRVSPHEFVLTNTGQDSAFAVRAVLAVDDELRICEADEVATTGTMAIDSPEAWAAHKETVQRRIEADDRNEAFKKTYGIDIAAKMPPRGVGPFILVKCRIRWRSAGGRWETEVIDQTHPAEFAE